MASLTTTGTALHLELTTREKLASLHGNLELPLSAVRSVSLVDDPLGAVTGIRSPGLGLPCRAKIGTWRRPGRKSFAVARRGQPAVQIELAGVTYDRLVVSVPDAPAAIERLALAAHG